MKVLKWFRYGFLILGFLFFVFFIYTPDWKFLPFELGEGFFQVFIASILSFVAYSVVRIIELCKNKNKFEPLILYYIGFIMSCIVYSNLVNHSPIYYFLEQPFSGKLSPSAKETIAWVYFILTVLFLLIGVIWELVKVCKTKNSIKEKFKTFSNVFICIGLSFVWIDSVWRIYRGLEYIPYVNIAGSKFGLISDFTKTLSYISTPLIIIGIVLWLIYVIENKEKIKKTEK